MYGYMTEGCAAAAAACDGHNAHHCAHHCTHAADASLLSSPSLSQSLLTFRLVVTVLGSVLVIFVAAALCARDQLSIHTLRRRASAHARRHGGNRSDKDVPATNVTSPTSSGHSSHRQQQQQQQQQNYNNNGLRYSFATATPATPLLSQQTQTTQQVLLSTTPMTATRCCNSADNMTAVLNAVAANATATAAGAGGGVLQPTQLYTPTSPPLTTTTTAFAAQPVSCACTQGSTLPSTLLQGTPQLVPTTTTSAASAAATSPPSLTPTTVVL